MSLATQLTKPPLASASPPGRGKSSEMTRPQRAAVGAAYGTKDALLEAQNHLFSALRRPQPNRERRWAATVEARVAAALRAIRDHRLEVEGAHGLYFELEREAPWVKPRIRRLVAGLARLEAEMVDLQIELARVGAGDLQAMGAVRNDGERALLALRDLLTQETDLVYERFNEPQALD